MTAKATPPSNRELRTTLAKRCAVVVLWVGAFATALLLFALTWHNQQQAEEGQQAIARSVAQTLASQTARAVRLGIPLDKLTGVETSLQQAMGNTPQLAYLALADVQGKPLHAVSRGASGPLQSLPVMVKGQAVAMVQAGASHSRTQGLLQPVLICAALVMLAAALTACAIYWGPASLLQRRHQQLQSALRDGELVPVKEGEADDALQAALQAVAAKQQRIVQARQELADYAAELRAVDFDQKMRPAIDAAVQSAMPGGAIQ